VVSQPTDKIAAAHSFPLNITRHGRQASMLRLAFLLFLAIWASNCQPLGFVPLREEDRRELAQKIEDAVEAAGRSQVCIKSPMGLASRKLETPIEARAGAEVYSAVMAALVLEAERNHLKCAVNQSRTKEGWRVADIHLSRYGRQVSRWKVREVRRILHAAIIIDDLGENIETARQLLALPYSLTFSVLPHLRDSVQTAEEIRRAGHEVMLHLPMQPEPGSHASPGEGEIRIGMTSFEVEQILQSDLASVPHAAGVNNHMGSRATTDSRLMNAVMRALAGRHLYFVDSRTTAASVALEAARQQGLPSFYRSVFLDDTETVPYTLGQLRQFRHVLEEQGTALAIGHPYPTTVDALAKFLPQLERDDVELAPASRLVRLPEVAHLKPPPPRAATP
jgi:polysaccharide deacetylase 2 family uncharacterized protein YibQ